MDNQRLAAHIFADAVGAQIEMQGMIAENLKRESSGDAPAHGENEFLMLKDRMESAIAEHYRG